MKPETPTKIELPQQIEKLQAQLDEARNENKALRAKVAEIKQRIEKLRTALSKIDSECVNHDTTAWHIAIDAIEQDDEMRGVE